MKVNIKQAEKLAKHYKINLEVINFCEWHYGFILTYKSMICRLK
jgi:hypothetical protein